MADVPDGIEATAPPKSRVDRLTARLRENPIVAVLIVVAAIVAGVASFTDSATKLVALFTKQSPTAARTALGQMNLPFTADAFVASAGAGDLTAVKLFVAAGMDPNASVADGDTALGAAAFGGRLPVMTALLDAGAKMTVDDGEHSALYAAVAGGHADALQFLLAKRPDRATIDSAFVVATRRRIGTPSRDIKAMRTLAAAGADARGVAPRVFATLWNNADDGEVVGAVQALLELGVVLGDLDGTNGETSRTTPLMDAASQGFARTADVLLAHGAALETRYVHPGEDDDGATALMMAAASRSASIVRAMLAKGAQADARDRRGLRAIDYANRYGPEHTDADVVRQLQQALR